MTGKDDDDAPAAYASPPCYMHEIDPAYSGLSSEADPRLIGDVMRWRKAERERLIGERLAVPVETRRRRDARIADYLEAAIGPVRDLTVSAYWPFRGEPDPRPVLNSVAANGGQCALPVVVARGEPLIFRAWSPGDPLERGVWNIPVPAETAPAVIPDVVIAPVVGFDAACFRLGYGGGFFDRTLGGLAPRPRVLAVGYASAAIATIYPQWHDIPMDAVITENGPVVPAPVNGG